MVSLLVTIVVIALLVGLCYYILDALPVPEPLNRIVKILIIVIGVIAMIYVLMGVAGNAPSLPRL